LKVNPDKSEIFDGIAVKDLLNIWLRELEAGVFVSFIKKPDCLFKPD
jgi:hypothetical protein